VKHGTPTDIVSDRGKHFISRFWRSLCQLLGIKANLSTAYHPETDGQTERVNQILEQYLRVYINLPTRRLGQPPSLGRVCIQQHVALCNHWSPPSLRTRASTPNSKCPSNLFVRKLLTKSLQISRSSICTFATRYRVPSNNTRSTLWRDASRSPIQGRGHCLLDARNIRTTRPSKKLDHRFLGPFPIVEKVSSHAFRLGLSLALSRIHPVFHVSLLQSTSSSEIPNRAIDPPPPIELGDSDEWEVHRILDSRIDRRSQGVGDSFTWSSGGASTTPRCTSWEPA